MLWVYFDINSQIVYTHPLPKCKFIATHKHNFEEMQEAQHRIETVQHTALRKE